MADKLVFLITHGPDNPERVTIPFTMATAVQALGTEVSIGFLGEGAALTKKGVADKIAFPGCAPLKDLITAFLAEGGKFYTCPPGLAARHITPEDLMDGVKIIHAGDFAKEFIMAKNVLVF
jgi:predicted peroxiredoxin